ncbi:hypothetical protein EYF80_014648 [Liparis tanakae]|uniref:Secreted protein n=1 Tax=Liparis tanakae TaxID=230148 RepID=A0A4Z2IC84_9TELE|nr:hypothetical protein EYF80_014648 [Liparis tanakae]
MLQTRNCLSICLTTGLVLPVSRLAIVTDIQRGLRDRLTWGEGTGERHAGPIVASFLRDCWASRLRSSAGPFSVHTAGPLPPLPLVSLSKALPSLGCPPFTWTLNGSS